VPVCDVNTGFSKETATCDCAARLYISSGLIVAISVFKEVAGNACAYFNPRSIIDIKTKIESVLKSQKKNKTLINNGFKRVQKFSWKKCSHETSHLYSNALKEKS